MRHVIGCLLAAIVLPIGGCGLFASHSQVRGARVDADTLSELVPGVSTRTDASSLLGTPTIHASFDDNTWLYIGSVTRPVIAGTQHVTSQQIVALVFDQAGVLRDVRLRSKQNALPMTIATRVTPSPGSNASFMQQLLGNVGRFNAGGNTRNRTGTAAGNGNGDVGGDSSRFSTGQ